MAVPAWSVYHPSALLHLDSDDHVLEDLVQGVTDVKVAIGVRGAIVENEAVFFGSVLRLPFVEIIGALAVPLRLELGVRTRALMGIN